jgi:hemerythrin
VSDRKTLNGGSAQAAIQSACVEALIGANLLALGIVRDELLLHASPALARMFGLALHATPMSLRKLVDERDWGVVAQVLAAPAGATVGLRAVHTDGRCIDLELSATRATLTDGPATVVAFFDLTGHGQRLPAPAPSDAAPLGRVQWSSRFEVGIEVIDGQHRHLFELIGRLQDALTLGKEIDQLVESLKDLVRYTEHHFATEERLMDEIGAAAERHRSEHQRLLEGLMRFTVKLDTATVSESSHFLQDWLFKHIDEVDRPFGALLRSRGRG